MADAAVEFLLNNLKDLLLYHSHLITGTKKEIESLEKDLRLFDAFLKDSVKKRRKDVVTQVLVREIRDVAYELENIIDAFVTQAAEKKHGPSFLKFLKFWKPAVTLHSIGEKVKSVKEDVEKAKKNFIELGIHEQHQTGKPEIRHPREKGVVGFTDVTEELISRLTETDSLEVISLIGSFGQGKTTLAWKIFNDKVIHRKFPFRIWLDISQEFSDKKIFLDILKEFIPIDEDTRQLDAVEIARKACEHLQREKFLIVMDDIWSEADWVRLGKAIPEASISKGKIFITSRIEDVGKLASSPKHPKKLRRFTEEESWELLQMEGLHGRELPLELVTIGKLIVKDCHYLPLYLVIIGGILAAKYSTLDESSMIKGWKKVSERVSQTINENDSGQHLEKFISLSYDTLPYHLRACFLYLGMFPEDYKIPASKLIRMWIGEGFIQRANDCSLEETALMYLEDLINRNLVTIDSFKANGRVKTCRVHDTLRDYCRNKAGNESENFLQEIRFTNGNFVPPIDQIDKYRHLSIHSNFLEFIASQPFGPRVRSFACISEYGLSLPLEHTAGILSAFKLVRVLDVKPIKFTRISSDMYQLVHARYIALSLGTSILPPKFSHLWNIQTLVVDTTSSALEVKADIWKLIQLRHFKTNVSATLPQPSGNNKHGKELLTLGIISVKSCTAELLERACNLKKLAIGGDLALLLGRNTEALRALGAMQSLEKLKLVHDLPKHKLNSLPQPYQFPSKLKGLTLVTTSLTWDFMDILGLLKNLEVLKLKEKAFMGNTWNATDGGFPRLEFLQIEDTDLTVWEAQPHHFPKLTRLVLNKCKNLLGVPIGLQSLKKLELLYCSSTAVSASKGIQEAKVKDSAEFKLYVFPPTE